MDAELVTQPAARKVLESVTSAIRSGYGSQLYGKTVRVESVTPQSDQWPIKFRVAVRRHSNGELATFELEYGPNDLDGNEDLDVIAHSLSTLTMVLIEEWLVDGPGPGLRRVG